MACVDSLNDAEVLEGTPIGDLVVLRWGRRLVVGVKDPYDPEKPPRIIHELKDGRDNPLNAVYGKRPFEAEAVFAQVRAQDYERQRSLEREDEQVSQDLRRTQERLERRVDGLRDLFRHIAGE